MSVDSDCEGNRVVAWKMRALLESPIFKDITFNCKDGKFSANRLILSIYSNFLMDVFECNPLIATHPSNKDNNDNGINLPEIKVADLANLIRVLNSGDFVDLAIDLLPGVKEVAKMLKIKIVITRCGDLLARVEAIPETTGGASDAEEFHVDIKSAFENGQSEEDEDSLAYVDDVSKDPDFLAKSIFKSKRFCGVLNSSYKRLDAKGGDLGFLGKSVPDNDEDEELTKGKVCPFCNMTCKSWQGMRRHIGHVHKENGDKSKQRLIACDCGETFSKNHNGKKLFRDHRTNCSFYIKSAFICDLCDTPFHEIPALNNHKFKVHGVNYDRLSCLCGQTFASSCSRRKHSLECNLYKSAAIFCDVCKSPFLTTNHLRQHLRSTGHGDGADLNTVSSQKTIICKCGQVFSRYGKHIYREHREKCPQFLKEAFVCDHCDAAFDALPSLTNHKYRAHGVIKGRNTCVCGLTFRCSSSCRKHTVECKIYRSNAAFCDECKLPFITKSHLEHHSLTHRKNGAELLY